MEKLFDMTVLIMEGAQVTLEIFFVTLILSLPIGALAALGRISSFAPLRYLMELYVWIMRGTPLMLQLLFVYFALPRRLCWLSRSTTRLISRKSFAQEFKRYRADNTRRRRLSVSSIGK